MAFIELHSTLGLVGLANNLLQYCWGILTIFGLIDKNSIFNVEHSMLCSR